MRRVIALITLLCALPCAAGARTPRVTIDVRQADLVNVLTLLATQSGANILADPSVRDEKVTLHLRNVTVADALAAIVQAYDLRVLRRSGVMIVGSAPHGAGGDIPAGARVYPLRYLRPSDAAAELKAVIPAGAFVADDGQNAVVVSGSASLQANAARFLRSIDVASPQVLFEVRVADLQPVNEQSNVGLELGGYDLSGQPLRGAATYAFTRNSMAINATINALVSEGSAEILATPKLVTLNNKEADLLIGQTYPVVYYDARLGGQQVQFVDIGVKLRLTPTIGKDGSVTAEMHPEYSAIQDFVGGYPVIANRRVDSTLRVKDNQTIVLGGLLRDIDTQTLSKIPGLANIPVIGKVFQNRQRTRQRDEIVFLITPHVIYPDGPVPDH